MRRLLYKRLLEWKDSVDRKPLILEGARQVGKTYLLKEFGRKEFESIVYVNCHEAGDVGQIFAQDLNVKRIMQAIEAYTGQRLKAGRTLLFIDEIQEEPHAIESLKYFCENAPELHIVAAGSLLGVVNRPGESFPVGKVNILRLYPMTFDEYLMAAGEDLLAQAISDCNWDVLSATQVKATELLRQYYYVGGMPEAVRCFVEHSDVNKVRAIQADILRTYASDFAKHAGNETQKIRMVWESIPAQLARENKKFIYGAVKSGGRARDFERAIQWLVDAGLSHSIHRCSKPEVPLKFYEDFNAFKLFLLDVGLLGAMAEVPAMQMLVSNNVFKEFKGAFSENFVLQQLIATPGVTVYYYSKDNSTQEVDFLIQVQGRIIPIEVKAEQNVKSKSLNRFITVDYAGKGLKGVRLSMQPYIDQGWMENIPLYAVNGFIAKLRASLGGLV